MANNPCSVGKERPSAGSLSFSAEAARRAHNPEVSGSNPLPATIFQTTSNGRFWFKHALIP